MLRSRYVIYWAQAPITDFDTGGDDDDGGRNGVDYCNEIGQFLNYDRDREMN